MNGSNDSNADAFVPVAQWQKEITVKGFWSSEKAGQFGNGRVL